MEREKVRFLGRILGFSACARRTVRSLRTFWLLWVCILAPLSVALGGEAMPTAKVFQSGTSQAIRLPKDFRFNTAEVEIFRRGDEVVLRERPRTGREVFDILAGFPDDFMADGRDDASPQARQDP